MTQHIQAYFRTEDQAESARISLHTLNVKNLEVGRLDRQINQGGRVLVPLMPVNAGGGVVGGNTSGVAGGTGPGTIIPPTAIIDSEGNRDEVRDNDSDRERDANEQDHHHHDHHHHGHHHDHDAWSAKNATDKDYDDLKYVLSATVMEADVESVVQKLRTNDAFVEVLD
ncbi:hypothetical protein [Paenibacillus campi]|uniref:hypothetical protein n=1 Tax=Paenibacillus campi TaxID=3106031 RepID=UPI002AFF2CC4|nr:hypothetical protein [Paenibacillus sp. SGZ-1014]